MSAAEIDAALLRQMMLPPLDRDTDKDGRGRVLIIGGAVELPGAVLLASIAALRAGAGKLQLATVARVAPLLGIAIPEARAVGLAENDEGGIAAAAAEPLLPLCNAADAVLVGPGVVDCEDTHRLVERLVAGLGERPTVVLDAGALACFGPLPELASRLPGRVVLTPHAGEMGGMLGTAREAVERDAAGTARLAAERFRCVVALKGAETHVAAPDGRLYRYRGGSVGLATSGSGDTLAGIVAGLLARGADPTTATVWAVFLHGAAGRVLGERYGPVGFLARELLDEIPRLLNGLSGNTIND